MTNVVTLAATAPPTPKETPTDWAFPNDEEREKEGCEEDCPNASIVPKQDVRPEGLQYIGTIVKAFLTGLLQRINPCFVIRKMMAPKPPAIPGAIPHAAKTCVPRHSNNIVQL
jgi:hypothetical protein